MKEELRWPKKDGIPTAPRDPYNVGRWPGMDDHPLSKVGTRRAPYHRKR